MFGLGLPELILIFLVIFLLFGAKALPEIAKGLGQAIKIFRREAKEIQDEFQSISDETKSDKDSSNDVKKDSTERGNGRPNTQAKDEDA